MIEFVMVGIGAVFLLIGVFELSLSMWNYHALAYAVHETSRYLAVKGEGCTKPGNTCSVTVANIATKIETVGIGLAWGSLNMTLTTDSGTATNCIPVTSCSASSTVWPPAASGDNAEGKKITVSASYPFNGMVFYWPGAAKAKLAAQTFRATSTQTIIF